jgi:hypothetical protein
MRAAALSALARWAQLALALSALLTSAMLASPAALLAVLA